MIYIRTDMNSKIATGHVMRCLAIADAAKALGECTTFILADYQACELVAEKGHKAIVLETQWDDMDNELPKLLPILKSKNIKKLLIDSYQVTENYLKILSSYVITIYMDDKNSFVYPVHALICYANYWKKFKYTSLYEKTKLFLGLEYVPLRKEFYNCREKMIKKEAEEILLLSGGTDPFGMLKNSLSAMDKSKYKKINVICGRYDSSYEILQDQYKFFHNIHIYQAVTNIEDYMNTADIAVSAGGSTLYELCVCGTPTISYSFADNQLDNVYQFQKDGIIEYAGDAGQDKTVTKIISLLDEYQRDVILRTQRSKKMQALIDGKGASRIVKAINEI